MMTGSALKQLRKAHGLTQGHAGEILGLSGAYVGELERDEKKIDARLSARIDQQLRARIDAGYSRALGRWTVTVVTPTPQGATPGRVHEVMGAYDTLNGAKAEADALKATKYPFAAISIHDNRPPDTTNPSGL